MKKSPLFVASLVMMVSVSGAIIANEKPTDDYQKAMKTLASITQALGAAADSSDFEELDRYTRSARPPLELVEKYWKDKKSEDALHTIEDAWKAIADLSVTIHMTSQEGASVAVKDLVATCDACHAAHREKLSNGTFEIK